MARTKKLAEQIKRKASVLRRQGVTPAKPALFLMRNPTIYKDVRIVNKAGKLLTIRHLSVLDGVLTVEVVK
jgi:hypothetical protein